MVFQCYAILDKAVGSFLLPFYCKSRGEALRMFMDAVYDEKSQFARHAGDYTLYQCGEFEDGSGIFSSREPERVISALEVVSTEKGG